MSEIDIAGLREFLNDYPGMSIRPSPGEDVVIKGVFSFSAHSKAYGSITDSYRLRISVPQTFPRTVPTVVEIDGRIPRDGKHHVNGKDHTLCLGSPLRLLMILSNHPTLNGYAENCLVPYLFAVTLKLQKGGAFVFNELEHGRAGVVADYQEIFGLGNTDQVKKAIQLLGLRKRVANKLPCPCDCGKKLGRCRMHITLARFRELAPCSWFRAKAYG